MEKQWITVRESESLPLEKRSLEGVRVDVLVSPYDVPEGVRGALREGGKQFVIEFKYISDEDTVEKQQDDNVKLRVGRNSGRLYALELDMTKFNANHIKLRLEVAEALKNVLTHLVKQPLSPLRRSEEHTS